MVTGIHHIKRSIRSFPQITLLNEIDRSNSFESIHHIGC